MADIEKSAKFQPQTSHEPGVTVRQLVSLTTVACANMCIGMVNGWAAVLPKLEEDSTKFKVTEDDVSWLVSFIPVLGIITSLFTGSLMELLGPRRMILLAVLPMPGFWLMKAYTPVLSLMYVGRAGLAITSSIIGTAIQPLVAELSSTKIRGRASSFTEIVAGIGVLVSFLLAHFLPWQLATAVCAIPCLPVVLLLFAVPESPYWLVRQNRKKEAEESLRCLMGTECDIKEQLNDIMTTPAAIKTSLKDQASQLRKEQNARPVLLLWVVFILRELGGKSAVFSYSVYMFRQAEVDLDPFVCTILIGVTRVVGNGISAITTDRLGRKPFLVVSSLVCGVSVGVTGLFLILDLPGKTWLPLVLVLIYVGSFGMGLGSIPWVYVGELIPTPVRSLGASLIVSTYYLAMFALSYAFLKVIAVIDLGPTLLIFSIPNLLVTFIACCWLPETRGKSLKELENAFHGTK